MTTARPGSTTTAVRDRDRRARYHFIHVKSRHRGRVAADHHDPTAHGGQAEDAFDLVLPSLPGYGFSAAPASAGWNPGHPARAWAELMSR